LQYFFVFFVDCVLWVLLNELLLLTPETLGRKTDLEAEDFAEHPHSKADYEAEEHDELDST